MEGSSSGNGSLNSSFGQYDENVILNCVRSRKKVSELPNCPVCSCTIRQGELETHIALEVERLQKLSTGGSKRKLSVTSPLALPGPSTSPDIDVPDDQEVVDGDEDTELYGPAQYSPSRIAADTRISALKAKIKDMEQKQNGGAEYCLCVTLNREINNSFNMTNPSPLVDVVAWASGMTMGQQNKACLSRDKQIAPPLSALTG
ncbi:Uncharacterized protein OBRU01_19816, partial [Operophtera brumata]